MRVDRGSRWPITARALPRPIAPELMSGDDGEVELGIVDHVST
jgi:hypothetical protein